MELKEIKKIKKTRNLIKINNKILNPNPDPIFKFLKNRITKNKYF